MNAKLLHFAAALASTASLLAVAQPADTPSTPEPIASAAKADSAEAVNAIVQALNNDVALKNAKITVAQDEEIVLLTGAAQTKEQVQRAGEIATASAGDAKVVNAIQSDHRTYQMPAYELKG